jgi:DNA-binding winged helix-turn-helix (wHTH) protein
VVDVHVGNLRRKLLKLTDDQRIETVRGVGFSLRHAEPVRRQAPAPASRRQTVS